MKLVSGICCLVLFAFVSCATLKPTPDDSAAETQIVPITPEEMPQILPVVPDELPKMTDQIPVDLPEPEVAVTDSAFLEPPQIKNDGFVLAEPDVLTLPDAAMPKIPEVPQIPEPPAPIITPTVVTAIPKTPEIQPDSAAVEEPIAERLALDTELPAEPEPEGGIWLSEEEAPYIAVFSEPLTSIDPIPSRKSEADLNQFIDIDYPGSGWIYLGENRSDPLLSFSGRKLTENGTQFVLRSKKPGVTVLHFYKQDLLKNAYIDDFIEVTVSDRVQTGIDRTGISGIPSIVTKKTETPSVPPLPESVPAVSAPEPAATAPVQASVLAQSSAPVLPQPTSVESERTPTVIQTDESSPVRTVAPQVAAVARASNNTVAPNTIPPGAVAATSLAQTAPPATTTRTATQPPEDFSALNAETLLSRAKEALTTEPTRALALLDAFFKKAVSDLDQGYLLRGQAYETRGPSQNIRSALESYQALMNLYPASPYWKKASERVTYLNRFYFNIR